jgi:hypothetical protein
MSGRTAQAGTARSARLANNPNVFKGFEWRAREDSNP